MQPMSCHPKHGRSSSASPAPIGRIHPHAHIWVHVRGEPGRQQSRVWWFSLAFCSRLLPCSDKIDTSNTSAPPTRESKVAETKTLQTISIKSFQKHPETIWLRWSTRDSFNSFASLWFPLMPVQLPWPWRSRRKPQCQREDIIPLPSDWKISPWSYQNQGCN